jgi:hypothetical protein
MPDFADAMSQSANNSALHSLQCFRLCWLCMTAIRSRSNGHFGAIGGYFFGLKDSRGAESPTLVNSAH